MKNCTEEMSEEGGVEGAGREQEGELKGWVMIELITVRMWLNYRTRKTCLVIRV